MAKCNYIKNTEYDFLNRCCMDEESISLIETYPKYKKTKYCCLTTRRWTEFYVEQIVDICYPKPDLQDIIEIYSVIDILSQRIIKTPIVIKYDDDFNAYTPEEEISNAEGINLTGKKLMIDGIVKQKVVYSATEKDGEVHSVYINIPFSTFVMLESNNSLSQIFKINAYIENTFVCKLSKRNIFDNITIFINIEEESNF